MKIKKIKNLFVFILLIVLIGCSSPQERIEVAKQFGDNLIYQQSKNDGYGDVVIVSDETNLYIVEIRPSGSLSYVTKIPKNRICEGE